MVKYQIEETTKENNLFTLKTLFENSDMNKSKGIKIMQSLQEIKKSVFKSSFIECLLWSHGEELDSYGIIDASQQFLDKIDEILDKVFNTDYVIDIIDNYAEYYDYSDFAHSMALTMNRHGAGLMDMHFQHNDHETLLTKFCHKIGELEVYVGDDNLLYIF